MFSASNYYEIGSNKGSYIKFGANSDRYFVQFTAAASKTKKLTFRQQVDNVEKSAIKELKEKLREQKVQLQKEFDKRDPENTGAIDKKLKNFPILINVRLHQQVECPLANGRKQWKLSPTLSYRGGCYEKNWQWSTQTTKLCTCKRSPW